MCACRSYEYKATSLYCDLTLGARQGPRPLWSYKRPEGTGGQYHHCLPHPSPWPCLPPPFLCSFLASWLFPCPGVPAETHQETEHFHVSCLHADSGHISLPPLCALQYWRMSFENISFFFFRHLPLRFRSYWWHPWVLLSSLLTLHCSVIMKYLKWPKCPHILFLF